MTDKPVPIAEQIAWCRSWVSDIERERASAAGADVAMLRAVLRTLEMEAMRRAGFRIIEIAFDDYDAAERAFDRLEHMEWIMTEGGTLSMYGSLPTLPLGRGETDG